MIMNLIWYIKSIIIKENEEVNWDKFHMDLMKQDKEDLKKVLKGAYNFKSSAGKNVINEDDNLDDNQKKKL